MTNVLHTNDAPVLPELQGHTIAFVDTDMACDAVIQALNRAGFPNSTIQVLRGEDGLHLLELIAQASSWGESAEDILKQGTAELHAGHSMVFVEVKNAREGDTVATLCTPHGAHGMYHFGTLVDTRLTA